MYNPYIQERRIRDQEQKDPESQSLLVQFKEKFSSKSYSFFNHYFFIL